MKIFLIKKKIKSQNACERYRNLSEEEKEKKHLYGRERYKIFLEDEKQRLVEYIKSNLECEDKCCI